MLPTNVEFQSGFPDSDARTETTEIRSAIISSTSLLLGIVFMRPVKIVFSI
jgi:hypothetical protein